MQFTHAPHATGTNGSKLALVVVFHVLLGIGLVKTMNVRHVSLPGFTPPVTLVPAIDPPVTPPPQPTLPTTPLPAPPIGVPMPDVPPTTPPLQNQVTTTATASEPALATQPATHTSEPAPTTAATGAATPAATVRAAALVDGCTKPAYPAQAARNGDSGTVTLALLVGVDGRVSGSRIVRSSGFKELDKAAVTALSLCTFKPAMQGDVAQAGWASIAYDWRLD